MHSKQTTAIPKRLHEFKALGNHFVSQHKQRTTGTDKRTPSLRGVKLAHHRKLTTGLLHEL
eukprot:887287-Lingulodinium_polyedra.AAC.1